MNRGSVEATLSTARKNGASMRPRFMNRGSLVDVPVQRGNISASMRPRFMNRGSGKGRYRVYLTELPLQ